MCFESFDMIRFSPFFRRRRSLTFPLPSTLFVIVHFLPGKIGIMFEKNPGMKQSALSLELRSSTLAGTARLVDTIVTKAELLANLYTLQI